MGHWAAFYTDEFMREHQAMLEALRREDTEREYAARCVVVAAHQATCPHCGQPMVASTPAQDAPKDVSADRGPAPVMPPPAKTNESWRDRPPLL
jgi:hypothetical protein